MYDHRRKDREFDSRRPRNLFFSSVRAGDNTNGYGSVPLATSTVWRGAPEMTVSKPTRFHELENISCIVLCVCVFFFNPPADG